MLNATVTGFLFRGVYGQKENGLNDEGYLQKEVLNLAGITIVATSGKEHFIGFIVELFLGVLVIIVFVDFG